MLGPVIAARSLGGAAAWGVISASFGVGAVGAGLFVLRVKPRRPLVVGNLLLTTGALPLLALALSRSVPLIAVANALCGFGLITLNALWSSTMQVLIPDKVRSRVDSYDWLVSLVIMPVGFAVAGPLSSSAASPRPWSAPPSWSRSRAPSWSSCPVSAASAGPRPVRSVGPVADQRPNHARL